MAITKPEQLLIVDSAGERALDTSIYAKAKYNQYLHFQPETLHKKPALNHAEQAQAAAQELIVSDVELVTEWVRDPRNPKEFMPIQVPRSISRKLRR